MGAYASFFAPYAYKPIFLQYLCTRKCFGCFFFGNETAENTAQILGHVLYIIIN